VTEHDLQIRESIKDAASDQPQRMQPGLGGISPGCELEVIRAVSCRM
jgi:hypothetical protein